MLIDLFHGVYVARVQNMQSYNLDGVLFLVHVVGGPKHPAEATLSNKSDVFELFVESACIKDVLER